MVVDGEPRSDDVETGAHSLVCTHEIDLLSCIAEEVIQRQASPPLVLVLIGKCGNGKSSVANTILGLGRFQTRRAVGSVTKEFQMATFDGSAGGIRDGGRIHSDTPIIVVDTPGLGDPDKPDEVLQDELRTQLATIETCLQQNGVLPRFVLLLVLGVHNRVTNDDIQAVQGLRAAFGNKFMNTTMVVWSHGDLLGAGGLDEYLANATERVQSFLVPCRSVIFNNHAAYGSDSHIAQVSALLDVACCIAGALPKLSGKAARRVRQAAKPTLPPPRPIFSCYLL